MLALAATLLVAIPAQARVQGGGRAPSARHDVDLEASAAFQPPRYALADTAQAEKLRAFLRERARDPDAGGGRSDVRADFRLERGVLTLSPRLAERLAADVPEEPDVLARRGADGRPLRAGEERRALHRRVRTSLARATGLELEESMPAFPAGYFPDDIALQEMPQWPLHNDGSRGVAGVDLKMPRVWEQLDGADTLVIAVLDAGYNFLHPDLQDTWFINEAEANGLPGVDDDGNGFVDDIRGWDFVDGDNDPMDFHGHGTQVGGVIAATFDNGLGMAGMLPRVKILPVRVLSTAGYGNTEDIANGVRYAARMGAHVINFSIGIPGTGTSTVMRNAFIAARDSGVIIAAASANDRLNLDTAVTQPASYGLSNVYTVASHNAWGELSGFSNYGANTVDIAAPGEGILTPDIAPRITFLAEDFESGALRWSFPDGAWQVAPDSLQGASALRWTSGNVATAVLNDTLVLRGQRGALLTLRLVFQPSGPRDRLYIDVQRKGEASWTELGSWGGNVNGTVSINLRPADDTLSRIRFQTCVLNQFNNNCSGNASPTGRVLRIDDLRFTHADETPGNQDRYFQNNGGTSLAAPFFAGYAGLMRLATDRTGMPLTRERMLAGAVPTPELADKVRTGGRLDVARGLDFYLKNAPRIVVNDTLDTSWAHGASVSYALSVRDSAGPRGGYTFSAVSAPPGATLTPGGLFAWNGANAPDGQYVLRARAEGHGDVLRAAVRFTLGAPTGVTAARPGAPSILRVGGRAFLLPPEAFGRERHTLRVETYAADGRTLQRITGTLEIPPGARAATYDLIGLRGATGLRAWLDGRELRAAKRE